jgi:sialic acid synthase SpsE
MVEQIRDVEAALGDEEKRIYEEEQVVRDWAHHSVATVRHIAAGATIEAADVAVKRPGTGIPAKHLEEVVGSVAARALEPDTVLAWDDLVAS